MPDPAGYPAATGMASGELERIRRELRASLALARPDSPVHGPILDRLAAIDAELSGQQAGESGQPGVSLCSCGFATDDPGWLDGHLFQHPGHQARPMTQYRAARQAHQGELPR